MSSKHAAIIQRLADLGGYKAQKYEREAFERGKEIATTLTDAVNGMDRQTVAAGFLEGILRSHRHLQSEAIFAVFQALGDFGALEERMTDPRNEAAHGACSKVREVLRDILFWRD